MHVVAPVVVDMAAAISQPVPLLADMVMAAALVSQAVPHLAVTTVVDAETHVVAAAASRAVLLRPAVVASLAVQLLAATAAPHATLVAAHAEAHAAHVVQLRVAAHAEQLLLLLSTPQFRLQKMLQNHRPLPQLTLLNCNVLRSNDFKQPVLTTCRHRLFFVYCIVLN